MISTWTCRTCGKQYTGKTADRFRYSVNNYKMEARKAEKGDMETVKQVFTKPLFAGWSQRFSGRCWGQTDW